MSFYKHGHSGRKTRSPEYRAWAHAIDRCYNPNDRAYHNYGGRGIRMCRRWRHNFESFLADMGQKPSPKHFLDRTNNNGNYEPSNCEWVTALASGRNTRKVIKVKYNGRTVLLHELPSCVSTNVVNARISQLGWSVKKAISTPLQHRTFRGTKPWIAAGMSKTSWYRAEHKAKLQSQSP